MGRSAKGAAIVFRTQADLYPKTFLKKSRSLQARLSDHPCSFREPAMKLPILLTVVVLTCLNVCPAGDQSKPNVILVMCDDLGYGDPQCFNANSPIRTPNIDVMAAAGMKFNRFYAAAPVCSPTRGSCLTGRHPYRFGVFSANTGHMKKQEITLPELLKKEGYTSGHFGKWHLGTLTTTVNDANRGGPHGKKHYSIPSEHGYDDSFVTESKVPTFDPMIKPKDAGRNAWDAIVDKSKAVSYGTHYWKPCRESSHKESGR